MRPLRVRKWAGYWWLNVTAPESEQCLGMFGTWDEAMAAADRAKQVLAL